MRSCLKSGPVCALYIALHICVHGFVGPDNYELYHDRIVHLGVMPESPYWSGDEEWDMSEGDVALPQAGSDEPVNRLVYSVTSTFNPGGPGGPCEEEGDVCDGDVALSRTGSD